MTPAELVTPIPLFPLPVVLFPGALMPLHIFEPRYRRMLAYCLASDRRFGITYVAESVEDAVRPGAVGCVAHIEKSDLLPDGRSNIAVTGGARFETMRLVSSTEPFLLAEVRAYEDHPDPAGRAGSIAERVRTVFERVARAARKLSADAPAIPVLPDDPTALSFAIPAMLDLEAESRQELLVMRSAVERLEHLEGILNAALHPMEERATVHARAKSNGTGLHAH